MNILIENQKIKFYKNVKFYKLNITRFIGAIQKPTKSFNNEKCFEYNHTTFIVVKKTTY